MTEKVKKKLVLFDIDDTLIRHVGQKTSWEYRYVKAMEDIYGKRPVFENPLKHNGSIERKIAWVELEPMGIGRDEFLLKFPRYIGRRIELFQADARVETMYQLIQEACGLVKQISKFSDKYILGLLTGNARKLAFWKLSHAHVPDVFRFGLYGEEADNRIALAKSVFDKAKRELGMHITGRNIIVIGDTVHDIRCGEAIGAMTIAVATGSHKRDDLCKLHPDLLVDSLMDKKVLRFFGLEN